MTRRFTKLRRVQVYICESCIVGEEGRCDSPGCLFVEKQLKQIPQPLVHLVEYLDRDDHSADTGVPTPRRTALLVVSGEGGRR